MNLFPNNIKYNVSIDGIINKKYLFVFPESISVSLMIRFIILLLNLDANDVFILYNAKKIDINDNTIIKLFFLK